MEKRMPRYVIHEHTDTSGAIDLTTYAVTLQAGNQPNAAHDVHVADCQNREWAEVICALLSTYADTVETPQDFTVTMRLPADYDDDDLIAAARSVLLP